MLIKPRIQYQAGKHCATRHLLSQEVSAGNPDSTLLGMLTCLLISSIGYSWKVHSSFTHLTRNERHRAAEQY